MLFDADVRRVAATALGALDAGQGERPPDQRDPQFLEDAEALAAALRDANPEVREAAARAFVTIAPRTMPASPLTAALAAGLVRLLDDVEPKVQIAAAQALATVTDTAAVEPLVGLLERSQSADVRSVTAITLGDIDDLRAAPILVGALSDEVSDVRLAAALALKRLYGVGKARPPESLVPP